MNVRQARDLVMEQCFAPADDGRVGLEYELLTRPSADPTAPVDIDALRAAVDIPLPGGSRVTFEPGGQLELSGPPCSGVAAAIDAMAADLAAVDDAAAAVGIELVGAGMDDRRPPTRAVKSPRYDAMEAFFDADGPAGRSMMCSTASIQVNVGLGGHDRWRLAHAVGPVLAAAFANSPGASGVRSTRQATWWALDGSRTAPADGCDWADYVLDANVLLIRMGEDRYVPQAERFTFRRWIDDGRPLRSPDADDLAYHLTTLFPPVRPRRWLELRMIDSLPDPWWRVAAAVTVALLEDEAAAAEASAATEDVRGLWDKAARHGLSHPALATAARRCFAAALDALPRLGVDLATADACCDFVDRYVARGRCPADDA